jgi:hypothetical protein
VVETAQQYGDADASLRWAPLIQRFSNPKSPRLVGLVEMKTFTTGFPRARARVLALAMLTLLAPGFGTRAWAQQRTPKAPVENGRLPVPDTNSVIKRFQVSPKLPSYRFVLKPDRESNNDSFDLGHIGCIDVFKGNSKVLWQRIDVEGLAPSVLTDSFRPVDINMDGYQDFQVFYCAGAKWGSHSYFLFDPRSGRFITNALTADLREIEHNGLALDPRKKEIRASLFIGTCLSSFEIYRIENGNLTLIESETHSPIKPGRCRVEKRKRVNGKLAFVEAKEQEHVPPNF